jgi:hypothetical protein
MDSAWCRVACVAIQAHRATFCVGCILILCGCVMSTELTPRLNGVFRFDWLRSASVFQKKLRVTHPWMELVRFL